MSAIREPATAAAVVQLDAVALGYGQMEVIRDLSLSVAPGEVLAVLGPNGAGKSTLLKGIVGLASRHRGRILIDGRDFLGMRPEQIAKHGVAYIPQGRLLFPYSTGRENVWSGGYRRPDRKRVDSDVHRFLDSSPVARKVARRHASVMSGGEQQFIAIGRGLMAAPKLLLIDEPSLGLSPILVRQTFELLAEKVAELSHTNGAIILVEQNVDAALEIADHVCVLVAGSIVLHGPRRDLEREKVVSSYLA